MEEQRQFATVKVAAAMTGMSAKTIRYWIKGGKMSATAAPGGSLVTLDDSERIAASRG